MGGVFAGGKPLVSVVVPTYKRAERINHAIDSIAAQTYGVENIELIVVSDNVPGSPEEAETDARLERYKTLPHFRLFHTVGATGGGAARNFACRQATGEYLAFLDDDDEYLPDKIETQLAFILENDLDLAWQDVAYCKEDGTLVEHRHLDHCRDFTRDGIMRAHLLQTIAPTAIYMLRKDLYDRTEGFGEVRTGQDWWLFTRCIQAGARARYMPGGYHVRQFLHNDGRLSLGQNKIDGENAVFKEAKKYHHLLSKAEVRATTARHYAVLAVASKRSGKGEDFLVYAAKAFATSPTTCISKGVELLTRGKQA